MTPTESPRPRTWRTSAAIRDDLPTPGGPVTPTANAVPGLRIELRDDGEGAGIAILDERDRPREGPVVARADTGDELFVRPRTPGHRRHSTARARPFRTADAV